MSRRKNASLTMTYVWFVIFFPWAIYRMWKYKQFNEQTRVIITTIVFFPYGIFFIWKKNSFSFKTRVGLTALAMIMVLGVYNAEQPESVTAESNPNSYVDSDSNDSSNVAASNDSSSDKDASKKEGHQSENEATDQQGGSQSSGNNEKSENTDSSQNSNVNDKISFEGYTLIEVDGGNLSGTRLANVVVDIGFGEREYYAFTNEHGQLIKVIANVIVLQNENVEPVTSDGRYYHDEAKVAGTELSNYDEGHVIADSLGGVANAYNITPQDSTLNRHGDQAYMEKIIRDAGGCKDFEANIFYEDSETMIPNRYVFTYTINGNKYIDEFENKNPESTPPVDNGDTDTSQDHATSEDKNDSANDNNNSDTESDETPVFNEQEELKKIDSNGNGRVTIAEAKAAGYSMPIYDTHWLYKYMTDRDKDGMVGE